MASYTSGMTAKERLQLELKGMSEEDAAALLAQLQATKVREQSPATAQRPKFVASFRGEPDLAARSGEIVSAEIGH